VVFHRVDSVDSPVNDLQGISTSIKSEVWLTDGSMEETIAQVTNFVDVVSGVSCTLVEVGVDLVLIS